MPKSLPLILTLMLSNLPCFAQIEAASQPKMAVGVKLSLLGIGGEFAIPLTRRTNLRGGYNALSYSRNFNRDGVAYAAQLDFRSVEAHYDWFPFGGSFHVSPGVLIYNGNEVRADATVPGGDSFELDNTTYSSDPTDPIQGKGKIDFKKAAPLFTVGWGNLLPRGNRHWSIPFELGAAYQNAPRATLSFSGSACDAGGTNCRPISSDPTVQANVLAEQNQLNRDMSAFKFYPLISIGFGYKF